MSLVLNVGNKMALLQRIKMRVLAGQIYTSFHFSIKDGADVMSGIERISSGGHSTGHVQVKEMIL